MKRSALVLLLVLCPTLAAFAEDAKDDPAAARSPEAMEILKKADAAARKVRAARFHSTSTPTGIVVNFVGPSEGEGVVEGWDEVLEGPRKFWSHVKTQPPGSDEAKEITGGGDGETYFLIDHSTRKAYEDMDPAVMGSNGTAVFFVGFAQFVHPAPYERDLDSEKVELLGKEEVAGEECYKVRTTYAGGAESGSTWYISTSDLLPRKRVRHYEVPQQGKGDLVVTLTRLEVDPDIEAGLFKMKLPEGYEQVDDFAP